MRPKKRTIDVVVAYEPTPSVSKKFATKLIGHMSAGDASFVPSRASRMRARTKTTRYTSAKTPSAAMRSAMGSAARTRVTKSMGEPDEGERLQRDEPRG